MKLELAQKLAVHITGLMAPHCERVEVAGSIRRGKPEVKDVEIVAIPKIGEPVDMFDEHPSNLLFEWAQAIERQDKIWWIKPNTHEALRWPLKAEGKYWRGWCVKAEVKLDLFLTTKERWGATFLIRTGSSDFSTHVMMHAQAIGWKFINGELHDKTGNVIDVPEETDVFAALGLKYVEPCERTGRVIL